MHPAETDEFDIVILATPMTKDKATLELRGLPVQPMFPRRYLVYWICS